MSARQLLLCGGIALAIGFCSRLAGAGIFGDMMMAIITVTWSNGINATGGTQGYELNLALGFLALVPAVFGAGRFSVDAELERRLSKADAAPTAERSGKHLCSVAAGDALVFRPLLIHASRKATSQLPRRVIHLEFAGARLPEPLAWAAA